MYAFRCVICHRLFTTSNKIELEDGRYVCPDTTCWKQCNCIICQDDGVVIGVDRDYCIDGSRLDKSLGEPKVSTILDDCRYYQKDSKAKHPKCTHKPLSAQLYSCEECDDFEEKIDKIDKPNNWSCVKCIHHTEGLPCKLGYNKVVYGVKCKDYISKTDKINHPPHYIGVKIKGIDIECIDVIEALDLDYKLGNVFKYLWRAGRKTENPKEDIQKAIWYLTRSLD